MITTQCVRRSGHVCLVGLNVAQINRIIPGKKNKVADSMINNNLIKTIGTITVSSVALSLRKAIENIALPGVRPKLTNNTKYSKNKINKNIPTDELAFCEPKNGAIWSARRNIANTIRAKIAKSTNSLAIRLQIGDTGTSIVTFGFLVTTVVCLGVNLLFTLLDKFAFFLLAFFFLDATLIKYTINKNHKIG